MSHPPALCPLLVPFGWKPMRAPALRKRAPRGTADFDRRAFWMAANQAIELAYAADHPKNTVLYGSHFASEGPGGTILLPKGVPDGNRWNSVLKQLRGISNQRKPDIIDFTAMTMYEIKPAGTDIAAGMVQAQSPIAIANAISISEGLPHWNPDLCTWTPQHLLAYAGDVNRRVCTGETDHAAARGLILYRVYRRRSRSESEEYAQAASITDLLPAFDSEREKLGAELRRVAKYFDSDADLWILCPVELCEAMQRKREVGARTLGRTLDMRSNPLMAMHAAMAAGAVEPGMAAVRLACKDPDLLMLLLAGDLLIVVIAVAALALPEVAGAGAIVGVGAEASAAVVVEQAAVVSLQAYRAARAAAAASALAKQASAAAAVLMIVASTRASAASSGPAVRSLSAIRAVSSEDIPLSYDYKLDREIIYLDQPYRIIGRARTAI